MKLLNAEGQTAFAGFSAHVPEYVNIPNFSPQKNSRTVCCVESSPGGRRKHRASKTWPDFNDLRCFLEALTAAPSDEEFRDGGRFAWPVS